MFIAMLICQVALLLYHQITTLVDFYPFNNIRNYTLRERVTECVVNGITLGIPPAGFLFGVDWMRGAAPWIYGVMLVAECMSWWRHYLFGATPGWQATYDRIFRETTIVLPAIKNHPTPNLEHLILHALTLLTAVLTWAYVA